MPQLNPNPWLLVLVFSWLILLTIVTEKVMTHSSPNTPLFQDSKKPKTTPWHWPWH